MSTTSPDADGVIATGPTGTAAGVAASRTRGPVAGGRVRPERVAALRRRRSPRFHLSWLPVPNDGSDPALPLGTCLVLRAVGGRPPRDVSVELPRGVVRSTRRLRPGSAVGLATPTEIDRLSEVGTVFVDWTSRDGVRRTAWLRVPPVPARYRARTGR